MEDNSMDKNEALTIVIEKLTEIVGNINQDGTTDGKSSGSSTPRVIPLVSQQCKENVQFSIDDSDSPVSILRLNESQILEDTAQTVEISTEPGSSPNQVVINLPVKVGNVSITNTEGLLQSLKQLDQGSEFAHKRDRETTIISAPKDVYKCSKCEYSSHNKHYLKQHADLVHTAERPFKCPLCDYAGKRSHSLKEHLVVHSPYRPFMCPFCSASFRKKGHLTNHVKLHASEQAMACSICKHFIANRGELSKHLRQAHVGSDVFLCQSCDYASTTENDIVMHMHTHGNPMVYSCSECKFIGVNEGVLKNHIQVDHDGEGSYTMNTSSCTTKTGPQIFLKCSECGFTTNDRESMKEHMYQNHLVTLDKQQQDIFVNMLQKTNSLGATSESDIGDDAPKDDHLSATEVPTSIKDETSTSDGEAIVEVDTPITELSDVMGSSEDILKSKASVESGKCTKLVYACSGCQFNSYERQIMVDHIVKNHRPNPSQAVIDNTTVEASTSSVSETAKSPKSQTPEEKPESYTCTHCSFKCHEAMMFITHMLSHTPKTGTALSSIMSRMASIRPGELPEEVARQGFMQDKAAGLYCCLICGYTCDHQRTIKAHIWKHSGHKDINYPTFQNGPLSMYEELNGETNSQGASNAEDTNDEATEKPSISSAAFVVTDHGEYSMKSEKRVFHDAENDIPKNTDVDVINRKRKAPDSKPSEMDMSIPKLRIVTSESSELEADAEAVRTEAPVVVQSMSNLYTMPQFSMSTPTTPRDSPHSQSPHPEPSDDTDMETEAEPRQLQIIDDEQTSVITEQVIESEDVVEVIVETTNDKQLFYQKSGKEPDVMAMSSQEATNQQPVSLRSLLQRQQSMDNNKTVQAAAVIRSSSVGSEVSPQQGLGISSSLLAVIEQFRRDASPGEISEDKDSGDNNYERVRNLFRCCVCHYTSRFVAGIKSHMRTHKVRKAKECSLCEFVAESSKDLQEHMLEHCPLNREPTYQCNECSCKFYYKNQYRAHMRLHSGPDDATEMDNKVNKSASPDTPEGDQQDMTNATQCYVCENCETSFTTVNLLLEHKTQLVCWMKSADAEGRTTGDKDCIKCNFCDFVGMSVRSLKSHMKRHWNDLRAKHSADKAANNKTLDSSEVLVQKHFVCERCTSVFDDIMDLLSHNSVLCAAAQIPKCSECNFVSSNTELFKKHMSYHNNQGKIYKCMTCDFVSKSYSRMDSHVKKHIEPCDLHCTLCDFVASSVRSLKSHMKRHTNDQRFVRQPLEQYKCNMCGYICHHLPALKSHMWRHASETTYSYEKTNAVINAAIEDGTQGETTSPKESAEKTEDTEAIADTTFQFSTLSKGSTTDNGTDSVIAFRCCHCFFETCVKKELNEHMKLHMDIIQKTMEVNNELFYTRTSPRSSTDQPDKEENQGTNLTKPAGQ